MSGRVVRRLAGLAAVVAVAPGVLGAQQLADKIVVTPYMGVYVPTNDIAKIGVGAGAASLTANIKHQTALVGGLNLSYWLTDRVGIEGGAAYTKSGIKGNLLVEQPGGTVAETGSQYAHVWLGSAKLMLQVLPQTSDFNLRLGFGPAIISRAGSAYGSDAQLKVTGKTDIGAALSLCSRVPVSSNVSVRLRAEDYMYSGKLGFKSAVTPADNFTFDSRFQHDLVFSAGLQLFLNR
jgi:outer membrane protein W